MVRLLVKALHRGLILDQIGRPLVQNRTSIVVAVDRTELGVGGWSMGGDGALTAALCLSEFPAAGTGLLTMMLLGVSVAVEWFWVVTAAKKITNVRMS